MSRFDDPLVDCEQRDGDVNGPQLPPAGKSDAESRHGHAEVGLDGEQARREEAREVPVRLGEEQCRRHPQSKRPEAPGPENQEYAVGFTQT